MNETLRCAWAFFIRDAQNSMSYRFSFIFGLVMVVARTLVMWLPAQLVGDNPIFADSGGFLAFSLTGSAMMGFFMASYGGFASAIRSEQHVGTLESVLVTRAPLSALLLGASLWSVAQALLDVTITLTAAVLIFSVQFRGSVFALIPIVLLTNLTFVAFGFFSAAFAMVFKRGDPFRMIVGGASLLFGGVFYPTTVLPKSVRWISELLPITHGGRALRGVALHGDPLSSHTFEIAVLALFALVSLPLGIFVFSQAVHRTKLDGTLLQY